MRVRDLLRRCGLGDGRGEIERWGVRDGEREALEYGLRDAASRLGEGDRECIVLGGQLLCEIERRLQLAKLFRSASDESRGPPSQKRPSFQRLTRAATHDVLGSDATKNHPNGPLCISLINRDKNNDIRQLLAFYSPGSGGACCPTFGS